MKQVFRIPHRPAAVPGAQQRGSTMIEVMIAIVVLALGMMGMLGMFLNSLKVSSGAIYRNTATQHAYMMADYLRANQANIQNYFSPTATATSACFTTAGCASSTTMSSNTQMPNTEYKVWETQLANLLPAGQGVVCRDGSASTRAYTGAMSTFLTCSNTGAMVVKVCWDESRIQTGNRNIGNSDNTASNLNTTTSGAQCIYTAL